MMGGNAEVDQWSVQVWYDDDGDDDDIDDDDGDGVDDDDDDDDQWSVQGWNGNQPGRRFPATPQDESCLPGTDMNTF